MEQTVLDVGAQRFTHGAVTMKLLGGFDQNVYECRQEDGHSFILKFLDATKYRKASIIRELTWMAYLAEHGVNVTASIRSLEGLLIEEIAHEGKTYYAIAFAKAPGAPLTNLESNYAVVEQWGRDLGRMHKLGKQDSAELIHRMAFPQWNQHVIVTDEFPSAAGEAVLTKWKQYMDKLDELPQDEDGYGIVHHDLHHHNFHVHNDERIYFDFGDTCYHWFAYDIAISIYHSVQTVPEQRRAEFTARFFNSFMTGYLKENELSEQWIQEIPFFINYRHLYSFVYFSKFVDWSDMDERTRTYLSKMKADIETGKSVVQLSI
ncbi:phosphotransferase enzyme family protein [Paenibacillus sp. JCM 10914]|uniref:phosphotransferase enzyme family protein n=1 Tax=Paenibacillus sp. JCM 10914 TaxID=1236974 RepID=UPI0003CC6D4B|nr:phosphotransferase [Paenibacillus sp. JCM 10914]GAE06054.1 putative protein kinase [Paenibacillus sp. JCM 10914]